MINRATAFAPATVANVGVGFDILGHAIEGIGDRVTATRTEELGIRIDSIGGIVDNLPLDATRNTAGRAVSELWEKVGADFGIALEIEKGIPEKSGMGGSAASAVGAVMAANALLPVPQTRLTILECALAGEALVSGSVHCDNVAPCLFGGLVLVTGDQRLVVKQVPVPNHLRCVLVHPHMLLATRDARAILGETIKLTDHIKQSAHLAGFLAGCFTNDIDVLRNSFNDVLIEPQRARLIPGFEQVQLAAIDSGALGCSISGAGPSIFAWCEEDRAKQLRRAMISSFSINGIDADGWISGLNARGAYIVELA